MVAENWIVILCWFWINLSLFLAGEITGSLFDLGHCFGGLYGDQRRLNNSGEQTGACIHKLNLCAHWFFDWPWSLKVPLGRVLFASEPFLGFIQDLVKGFIFLVKVLFCIQVSIWYLVWCWGLECFTEIGWEASSPFLWEQKLLH